MSNILILEPDERIGRHYEQLLTHAGYQCCMANQIGDGLAAVQSDERMLTMLNARMPWSDSFTFLKTLQEKGWPVLFMTTEMPISPRVACADSASSGSS